MAFGKSKSRLLVFILVVSLIIVGCVRNVPDEGDGGDVFNANVETGEQGVAGPGEANANDGAADAPSGADDAAGGDEADTPRDDAADDTAVDTTETEGDETAADETDADAADTTKEEDTETPDETTDADADKTDAADDAEEGEDAAETTETPGTHTVAAGENLYQIGLKYGVSWVTLAEVNDLANPNQITVGQTLQIPGQEANVEAEPEATPSPLTETTYTVKAGDNLFRIGLAYGISWVQIAEANGIVNPNQIVVGDVLKIPVDTPGPAPQFTHEVKAGETLFLISVQYGVTWTKIAEANDIGSPYVIYPGQTLVIPGE